MKKLLCLLSLILVSYTSAISQNVGISADPSNPDPSAMLDVKSTNKGMLIPRLTSVQRAAIITPADGLTVYDTDTKDFWFYNSIQWTEMTGFSSWLKTGNANINPNNDFIGTTDHQPLVFKVNKVRSGYLDENGNVYLGPNSGNLNIDGFSNIAIGSKTLHNDMGNDYQVAIGAYALSSNAYGSGNTAVGYISLQNNVNGLNNAAFGAGSLSSNTDGVQNTSSGYLTLYANTTGSYNIAVGAQVLQTNTTGSKNTAIGYRADVSSSNLSNTISIGSYATASTSNTAQIGNSSITDVYFGNGTSTILHGTTVTVSDARFKYDIKSNVPGLDFITKLKPVTYYLDLGKYNAFVKTGIISNDNITQTAYNPDKQLHTGFLAQDVEKVAHELGYKFDGLHAPINSKDHYSLSYAQFIMPLVKGMQQQQVIIENLQTGISNLKVDNSHLTDKISRLDQEIQQMKATFEKRLSEILGSKETK